MKEDYDILDPLEYLFCPFPSGSAMHRWCEEQGGKGQSPWGTNIHQDKW